MRYTQFIDREKISDQGCDVSVLCKKQ